MKKIILIIITMLVLCGCANLNNTPTKKVEKFLNNYQTLNSDVLDDLNNTLDKDTTLSNDMKEKYRDFMKKHYQDLTYEIKNETINGDTAEVDAEITVRDYSDVVGNAESYRIDNKDKFNDDNGNYDVNLFTQYRLEKLKEVKKTSTYTIKFNLIKKNDTWKLEELSKEDISKINGLYMSAY